MNFVSGALFDGRRLRALTLLDVHTREALATEVDQGIKGEQVVAVLDAVVAVRRAPKCVRIDNGPEFVSNALDRWAYEHGVVLDFSRPGSAVVTNRLNQPTTPSWSRSTGGCARSI